MGGWVQAAESSISSLFLPKRNQTVARPKESEKEENQGGDGCEEREKERERARVFASTITAELRLSLWGFYFEHSYRFIPNNLKN